MLEGCGHALYPALGRPLLRGGPKRAELQYAHTITPITSAETIAKVEGRRETARRLPDLSTTVRLAVQCTHDAWQLVCMRHAQVNAASRARKGTRAREMGGDARCG